MIYLYYKSQKNKPVLKNKLAKLPRVTIQLPIYNERLVVERLIESAANLDYPPDRLQIQVLDDSTRLSVKTWDESGA